MHCWVVCQVDRTLGQTRTLAVGYRCRGRLGILNSTEPQCQLCPEGHDSPWCQMQDPDVPSRVT